MSAAAKLRAELERRKGRAAQIEEDLRACKRDLKHTERDTRKHEQAKEVVRKVGLATQQQLEYHFSDVVTSALEAVFPSPYSLSVKFVERRGKTECDLGFEREGEILDPLAATGGGAIDVASFALRIAAWSMQRPRPASLLVLDEPFRHLSSDLQDKAGAMLRELSTKLRLQMLLITHEERLEGAADRLFEVRQRKGISEVKRVD
jgi:ABC-type uncharacterized transport system YnjBCD ATPase subunit